MFCFVEMGFCVLVMKWVCVWIGNENYIIIVQVCVYLCMLFMMATQLYAIHIYAIYSNYYYCHNRKIAIHTLFGFILFHNVFFFVFVRLLIQLLLLLLKHPPVWLYLKTYNENLLWWKKNLASPVGMNNIWYYVCLYLFIY